MIMTGTAGEIITFYSYKGGTGRSMALSNVACLLAEQQSEGGGGILMIDWDLEAPGLDRFFHNKFKIPAQEFRERKGLIDLFMELDAKTPVPVPKSGKESEKTAYDALDSINLDDFIVETVIDHLSMLKAGRFDENYSTKVNSFDWESLHSRSPLLIRLFAERLSEKYRYVLIDSRTGYTDISGICTMLMPEKLVVVFSPNRQSHTGIKELVKIAMKYRRMSDDLRPLLVFPLPSRIEFSMDELRRIWRFGKKDKDIEGFQPMFENLFKEVYNLEECKLQDYFDEVQIQQNPYYAYGEEIAVIANKMEERFTDRFTLAKSFSIFTEWLVNSTAPWQQKKMDEKIYDVSYDDIFLSYANVDRQKAQVIAQALEKQGFSVWWDRIIPAGMAFDEAIGEKIRSAKCVIVLWSKESVKSMWVKTEASEGYSRGILIPVLIENVKPPLAFSMIESANLIDWDGRSHHSEFDRLLKYITSIKSRPEEKIFINSIGMRFILIPAGKFMMGSEESQFEKPVHIVTISKPFYLGIYPVTQQEWNAVMGENPSYFREDNLPVENVSWNDVQKFIKKLNQMETTDKYRLPSEAEWEYAARAETTTRYSFGDDESKLGDYAWYAENSGSKTHPVGQKKPNPWGVYDMHGNVWEWVQDKWHGDYNGAPTDGSSWESDGGSSRVVRGGSWSNDAGYCRSAARDSLDPGYRGVDLGFRLLRIL